MTSGGATPTTLELLQPPPTHGVLGFPPNAPGQCSPLWLSRDFPCSAGCQDGLL